MKSVVSGTAFLASACGAAPLQSCTPLLTKPIPLTSEFIGENMKKTTGGRVRTDTSLEDTGYHLQGTHPQILVFKGQLIERWVYQDASLK